MTKIGVRTFVSAIRAGLRGDSVMLNCIVIDRQIITSSGAHIMGCSFINAPGRKEPTIIVNDPGPSMTDLDLSALKKLADEARRILSLTDLPEYYDETASWFPSLAEAFLDLIEENERLTVYQTAWRSMVRSGNQLLADAACYALAPAAEAYWKAHGEHPQLTGDSQPSADPDAEGS